MTLLNFIKVNRMYIATTITIFDSSHDNLPREEDKTHIRRISDYVSLINVE